MRVRLGFAIAVHCEPDILLVDEVLSVGDLNFKAKCIQKIEELRATVSTIFISHNMFQIDSLCSKALLMDKGTILSQGDTRKVINDYYNLNIGKDLQMNAETTIYESIDGLSDVKIEFTTDKGRVFFYPGDNVKIKFSCNSEIEEENLVIGFSIKSMEGLRLITQKSTYKSKTFKLKKGYNEFCCTLENIPLLKGSYSFLFNFRGLLDNRIVSGSGPNLSVFNRNDDVPDTGTVDSIVIWD
jgi:lipopolysaccharide transport system ATP-binding protein